MKGWPQEKVVKCQTEQVKTQNKHISKGILSTRILLLVHW